MFRGRTNLFLGILVLVLVLNIQCKADELVLSEYFENLADERNILLASSSDSLSSSSFSSEEPWGIWDYFFSFFFSLFWYSTAIGFISVTVSSILLLFYFAGKGTRWYVYLITVVGWILSFSVVFLIPLDIGLSSCYHDDGICLLSSSRIFLFILWQIIYWVSLVLTWIVAPFMQSYVMSGDFTILRRVLRSLKENTLFYGTMVIIWSVLIVLILLWEGVDGIGDAFSKMKGVILAASYTWGILLMVSFLSYGLIDIPRRVWFKANRKKSLRRCQFYGERYYARFLSSKNKLNKVLQRIKILSSDVTNDDKLRPYVDILEAEAAKINVDFSRSDSSVTEVGVRDTTQKVLDVLKYLKYIVLLDIPFPSEDEEEYDVPDATYSYVASTRRALRNAHFEVLAAEKRWDGLVKRAMHLSHVIESSKNKNRGYAPLGNASAADTFIGYYFRKVLWVWHVYVFPISARIFAVLLGVLSLIIIYSELVFFVPLPYIEAIPLRIDISPIGWVINCGYVGDIWATVFVTLPFSYMALCVYYSFFQLSLMNYYRMSKRRTDNNSLLFSAAYTCRLIAPLCYNFLCIVHRTVEDGTDYGYTTVVFSEVMGDMRLVPILGPYINIYFPCMVIILSLLIGFRVHEFILNFLHLDFFYYGSGQFTEEKIRDGSKYISDEIERRHGKVTSSVIYSRAENGGDADSSDEEGGTMRLARREVNESEMTDNERKRWEIRKKYSLQGGVEHSEHLGGPKDLQSYIKDEFYD